MNAIMNKTNNGKLLAAVVAMLMIVCAVAVVASPTSAADDKTVPVFSGDKAVAINVTEDVVIGDLETLFDGAETVTDRTNYYDNGTLTIPAEGMIITLSDGVNMGTAASPLNIKIVLNGDLQIKGTGNAFIKADGDGVSTVVFNAADSVLDVTGGAKVTLDANGSGSHVLNNNASGKNYTANVSVSNKSVLTITHELGSSSWFNADGNTSSETYLTINDAEVKLTEAHSIQGVVLLASNNAKVTINGTDTNTGMTLKNGTVLDNSAIVVENAGFAGIMVKGAISLNNGASIDVKASNAAVKEDEIAYPGINMANRNYGNSADVTSSITMDSTSSVTTDTIGASGENADTTVDNGKVSINGGTFTGDFVAGTNTTATTVTVNGTTISGTTQDPVTADKTITVEVGNAGVVVGGNVDLSNAAEVKKVSNGTGMIIPVDGAELKLPTITTVDGLVVPTTGENANEITVTTAELLVTAASQPDMKVIIGGDAGAIIELTQDLIIAEGTSVVLKNGTENTDGTPAVDLNTNTIKIGENIQIVKQGSGNVQMKLINGTNNLTQIDLNGEFTIKQGSVFIDDAELLGDNYVITRSGEVRISGDLSGNLTIIVGNDYNNLSETSMPVIIFDDFTVNAGATLQLATGKTVNGVDIVPNYRTEGDFNLYGSLIADGAVSLTVGTDSVYSDFTAFAGAVIQQNVTLLNGGHKDSSINLDDSLRTMEISIDVTGHQVYSQMQTVIIITSLDITPYATLEIMGKLIVNEGVTLTVQENATLIVDSAVAQMIVNGSIVVDNKGTILVSDANSVTVTGSITSDGAVTINSDVTIEENGKVLIQNGTGSAITVTGGLTIETGGELEVRGKMTITPDVAGGIAIANYGTIILNGAKIMANSTINMAADGAVVNIMSFTGVANAKLTITDDKLVLEDVRNSETDIVVGTGNSSDYRYNYPDDNEIFFTSTFNDVGVRNITITEVVTSEKDDNDVVVYDYGMNIAGTPTIFDDTTSESNPNKEYDDETDKYTITLNGVDMRVAAETTLTLGTYVVLDNDKILNVAGTVYAINTGSEIINAGTINVTGMIETIEEIDSGINAATYDATVSGATHYYYTTLNAAVAAGAEDIEVLGSIKITESLTIPAPIEVSAASGATMQIGDEDNRDVTVTVENGATVKNFKNITVDGTLSFANNRDSKTNTIVSDVTVTNDPAISYTNIYNALGDAAEGDTVTISRTVGNVVLNADIEVPAGVTLVIPNSRAVEFNDDVTMTVNGTVQKLGDIVSTSVDGFYPYDANGDLKDEYATIIVNGTILSLDVLPYKTQIGSNGEITEQGYYIPGAYYNIVNNTGDYEYITPVAQAAAVSNDVRYGDIKIYGENTVGDIAFTGDEDEPVEVTLQDDAVLTAGTITLAYATLIATATDCEFTGTVANTVGSVVLANVKSVTVADVYDDETQLLTVAGAPAQADDKGVDAAMTVVTGNVTVIADLNVNNLEEFEIASGATMTVSETTGKVTADEMTVNGTLISTNGGTVNVTTLTVRGTFTVAEKTADNAAGKADVNTLFVGIAQNDEDEFVDASAAAVTADSLGNYLSVIVVSAESTVTGKLIDGMDSTEFFVEDALWITAYVSSATSIYAFMPGDLSECAFNGWNDADGKLIDPSATANVGMEKYLQVYANIEYNVYVVVVNVDNGIGDVAIDGQLLVYNSTLGGYVLPGTGYFGNGFTVGLLDAGQHTVTYTLKPNFEGTATLASNGINATVSGLTFTLSGDYENEVGDYNVNYLNLSGATPSDTTVVIEGGNGGSGEMGLTDYLLIILVILIVVMAIMVAMRLMRS